MNRSGLPRTSRPPERSKSTSRASISGSCRASDPINTPSSASPLVGHLSSSTRLAVAKVATRRPTPTPARVGSVSATCGCRLLYAAKFADVNILLSDRINPASKIIYDRTPRERVQGAAPWLKVDGDAYPAVVEGRIVWIVDGYTTSDSYPNSERVNLNDVTSDAQTSAGGTVVAQPQDDINYMRNSVKAVVDAYDGSVKLYAWDDTDPVLKAWSQAFPNIVQPKSAISKDLLDHLRYPQDFFKVQRQILARYHMTNPDNWYQRSSLWDVPNDPVSGASAQTKEPPFYLSVKWPGDNDAIFSLTSSYVPFKRSNLAAYMAVNADASSPEYGRMRILQMSDTISDRRTRTVLQRHDHQRDGGRSTSSLPEPGRGQRDVRQPADLAGRWRAALRDAGLHPASGQHRLISRAPLRRGAVWSVGRHR